MEMIMQTKFKVGDKVRCVEGGFGYITEGCIYEIATVKGKFCHVITDSGLRNVYHAEVFELVEPNPILTPEEVFEHLRKGTKLQWAHKSTENWCNYSGDVTRIKVNELFDYYWRIKPEPEVIELNGKRYKLIEE